MECTILAQEKVARVFHNRPLSFKAQSIETGADWELAGNLGSVRWAPPELTFTDHLKIYWDDLPPMRVEYHPGSATGSSWVVLPQQRVVFVGDSVVVNQPPFLATADLPLWIGQLETLLSEEYREYLVVSGRGGLASYRDIHTQLLFLRKTHERIEKLAAQNTRVEQMQPLSLALLADYDPPEGRETQFRQRLHWGLRQYYLRHYQPNSTEIIEE
jgi:glyoxylase-like metal-dependent hydrolase (beta-lactamase superfamily II)